MNERHPEYWLTHNDFEAIPTREVVSDTLVENPRVTVLMLAWKHAEYIDEAIESVIGQRYEFPFELIIGEDCSSDGTLERTRTWQERYPESIRIVTAEQNVGMHRNFARIWHRARGEYIALCEGDDYWVDPAKLQKQVDWFDEHPASSLLGTFTDRIEQDASGEWKASGRWAPVEIKDSYRLKDLIRSYSFHFSSVMLRKNAVRFPRWFWDMYCVDRPLYLLAAQHGSAGLLPEVTSRYRQHAGGLWSPRSPLSKAAASTALFSQLQAHLGEEHAAACRQTLSGILWSYMSEAVEDDDWSAARKLYWQSLREYPRGVLQGRGENCRRGMAAHPLSIAVQVFARQGSGSERLR